MTHTRCHIVRILREQGLRQRALAGAIGCTTSQVSNWSHSRSYPTVGTVLDILTALERLTGRRWDVREVWTVHESRPPLPPSYLAHNRETSRITRIAAQVRRKAVA